MEVEQIFSNLNSISPLDSKALDELQKLFVNVELKRNDYLVREGSMTNSCYFLTEGVVRVFYNKDGNEYNKTFFTPGMFPTPITALLSDTPSALSFQALVPAKLISFSYKKFIGLFDNNRCLETLMLRIMEQEWIKKERHDIQMVTNDATTNYLIFRNEYPNLENQIPQYHIASYLGITPIQLSRIRAKLTKTD